MLHFLFLKIYGKLDLDFKEIDFNPSNNNIFDQALRKFTKKNFFCEILGDFS